MAAIYLRVSLVATMMDGLFDLWKRWLACQRLTKLPMIANMITTLLMAPILYFYMFTMGYGLIGSAYAWVTKSFLTFAAVVIYCKCSDQVKHVL